MTIDYKIVKHPVPTRYESTFLKKYIYLQIILGIVPLFKQTWVSYLLFFTMPLTRNPINPLWQLQIYQLYCFENILLFWNRLGNYFWQKKNAYTKVTTMCKIHNKYLSPILPKARSNELGTLKITVCLNLI